MSLNRCSRSAILVVAVVALVATASVGAAVTVGNTSAAQDVEVGATETASVEVFDLYDDHAEWQIAATTELEDAEWTVEQYRDGELIEEETVSGDQVGPIELDENASEAPDTIWVEVEGTVPEIETFSYEDGEPAVAIDLVGHDGSGEFEVEHLTVDRYTTGDPGSADARQALDDASDAIEAASDDGTDVAEAEERFAEGVDHYDDGDFADAVAAADDVHDLLEEAAAADDETADEAEGGANEDASDDAEAVDQPASDDEDGGSGILPILLYGLGFVALVAVVGGVLYARQQRDQPSRDPLG